MTEPAPEIEPDRTVLPEPLLVTKRLPLLPMEPEWVTVPPAELFKAKLAPALFVRFPEFVMPTLEALNKLKVPLLLVIEPEVLRIPPDPALVMIMVPLLSIDPEIVTVPLELPLVITKRPVLLLVMLPLWVNPELEEDPRMLVPEPRITVLTELVLPPVEAEVPNITRLAVVVEELLKVTVAPAPPDILS